MNKDTDKKTNRKMVLLGLLGAAFLSLGLFYRLYGQDGSSISYEYLGIGTWSAALIFYMLFPRYKEVTFLIMGLLVLHAGVLLILKDHYSNPKLLGLLVFTSGIIVVLGSGFSDRKKDKKPLFDHRCIK